MYSRLFCCVKHCQGVSISNKNYCCFVAPAAATQVILSLLVIYFVMQIALYNFDKNFTQFCNKFSQVSPPVCVIKWILGFLMAIQWCNALLCIFFQCGVNVKVKSKNKIKLSI